MPTLDALHLCYTTGCSPFGGVTTSPVNTIPEPRTWVMLLAGFGLLAFTAMRKDKRKALAA